jgi:hypothetical protein
MGPETKNDSAGEDQQQFTGPRLNFHRRSIISLQRMRQVTQPPKYELREKIRGSHSGGYEEFCHNIVYPDESHPTFRRKIPYPSSRVEYASKKPA